jgi:hypothetical protein
VAVVVRAVRDLEKEFGVAQAAAFVERARPEDSPLHPLFTWDDSKAGERWRIQEARQIIRSVRVTFHEAETVAPAFLNVTVDTGEGRVRGYVETTRALSDKQMRKVALDDALRQLRAWQRKYRALRELSKVVSAIDAALDD